MFTGMLGLPCCQAGRLVPSFVRRCTWEIAAIGSSVIVRIRTSIAAIDPEIVEFMVPAKTVEAHVAAVPREQILAKQQATKNINPESNEFVAPARNVEASVEARTTDILPTVKNVTAELD